MFLHCLMQDTEGLAQRNGSSRVLMFHLLSSLVVVVLNLDVQDNVLYRVCLQGCLKIGISPGFLEYIVSTLNEAWLIHSISWIMIGSGFMLVTIE